MFKAESQEIYLLTEILMFHSHQRFGQHVSYHILSQTVYKFHLLHIDGASNKVVLNIDIFSPRMIFLGCFTGYQHHKIVTKSPDIPGVSVFISYLQISLDIRRY